MKRKLICFLASGLLMLSGCGEVAPIDELPNSEVSQSTDADSVTDEAEEMQGADSRVPYTWQEITITVPAKWEDACVFLEEEDGFAVYQKASYEKDEGSGYICGFRRTEEYISYGLGETLIAYTDKGLLYYLMQPTDVACDTRDEAILNEYIGLCGDVSRVKASLEITASGIHCDAEEYVLPLSGIAPLREEMLQGLSDNDLWIARNEIYARHGRQFASPYLRCYFERCTWYEGTVPAEAFDDSVLSQVERDNIALLLAAEQKYDELHPYPKRCDATETASADLHGDGTDNSIGYHVVEQANGETQCYLTVDGVSYLVNELVHLWSPREDVFYVADIVEGDGVLEIAVLDDGPSADPVTFFFRLEETLSYMGQVSGYPFAAENGGINGFNGYGGITGQVRMDLIETVMLEGYWRYDAGKDWIVYQDLGVYEIHPVQGHTLYEDLPVHVEMDENSELTVIPAQEKVFFIKSDMYEWILVKGKDGSLGYMRVKDGIIVELDKPANEVFSDLYFAG